MPAGFSSLGIRPDLVDALKRNGLKEPTPIQVQTIPLLLQGRDVIAQAQTGTGKTLAFLLPILERVEPGIPAVQALILTPTRELAIQITAEARKLAPLVGANVLATYGGQDVDSQIRRLQGATHVVVATPGRLLDHLRRGTIQLGELSILVLDEADQMLHIGFLPEVKQIVKQAPAERTTVLCSATMPPQIRSLAERYMRTPTEITIETQRVTLDEIRQLVVETTDRQRQDALCQQLDAHNPYLALIFCRTQIRADKLVEALATRGYNADVLHGGLSQSKREQVMDRFRDAKIQYLVATDVAARGLDVEGVTHVYNYDLPGDVESYIHRIGRTGRAGQTGVAVTFVAPKDEPALREIEQGVQSALERVNTRVPDPPRPEDQGRTGGSQGYGGQRDARPAQGDARSPRDARGYGGRDAGPAYGKPASTRRYTGPGPGRARAEAAAARRAGQSPARGRG